MRLQSISTDLCRLRHDDHGLRRSDDGGFPISELMAWRNYSFKDIMDAVVMDIGAYRIPGPRYAIRQGRKGQTCLHFLTYSQPPRGDQGRSRPFPKDRRKKEALKDHGKAAAKATR